MERIEFAAADGYPLAVHRFDPHGPVHGQVLIAPAMAVAQGFYAHFARWLASRGYVTWTFDYRGIGASRQGPLRRLKADLNDWLLKDYAALLAKLHADAPGQPLFVVGHSFGGQVAPLLPLRDKLAGLVNIAVGSGSTRHLTPRTRRSAPIMWHLLAPALCPVFGYFPGGRIGVVGDLPTGAMMQWRRWCLTPDYLLTGEPGAREAYASAGYPVLALTFADDELLHESGAKLIHGAYRHGRVDYRRIEPAQFGLSRIGHFGFFKPQSEARLWPPVAEWLDHAAGAARRGT